MTPSLYLYSVNRGTVDLYNGVFKVQSWETTTGGVETWENMSLVAKDVTDAQIRTTAGTIDKMIEDAQLYASNILLDDPIWLYWQSEGETAKRALIFDGAMTIRNEGKVSPLLGADGALMNLTLERHPLWEDTAGTILPTWTNISHLGGTIIMGNVKGTAPQRLKTIVIDNASDAQFADRMWIGIRPPYQGFTGFQSVWELDNGDISTYAAGAQGTVIADADASGGTTVAIDFGGTAVLAECLTIRVNDVLVSNFNDMIGQYLLLARCRVDAATTDVRLQLKHGWLYLAGNQTVVGDTYISGMSNYHLIELGQIKIPPTGDRDSIISGYGTAMLSQYGITLAAERLSAGGTLYLDNLIFIPSEHLFTVSDALIQDSIGELFIFTDPDDSQYAFEMKAVNFDIGNVEYSFTDWYYPMDGGMLVLAGDYDITDTHQSLTAVYDFTITFNARWRSFNIS